MVYTDGEDIIPDFPEMLLTLTGNSQLQCLEDLSRDTFRARNWTFPSEQHSTIVMTSCNGLVILGSYYQDLSIWNPSTGFFRKIPDPQLSSVMTKTTCWDMSGRYGFGYVSATDDYKLVLVIPNDDSGAAQKQYDMNVKIFIFSVRANTWSSTKSSHWAFPTNGFRMHCGVYLNEAIHWCVNYIKYDVDGTLIEACYIYAFDLASEEVRQMPVPAGFNQDDEENYHFVGKLLQTVVHLGGCLCRLSQSRKSYEGSADIGLWMMRDYGVSGSWMKVFEFSENDLPDGIASPSSRLDWTHNVSFVTESGAIVIRVLRKFVRIECNNAEKPVCSIPCMIKFWPPEAAIHAIIVDTIVYAEALVSVPESL